MPTQPPNPAGGHVAATACAFCPRTTPTVAECSLWPAPPTRSTCPVAPMLVLAFAAGPASHPAPIPLCTWGAGGSYTLKPRCCVCGACRAILHGPHALRPTRGCRTTVLLTVMHSVSETLPFPVNATLHIPVVCADPVAGRARLAWTEVRIAAVGRCGLGFGWMPREDFPDFAALLPPLHVLLAACGAEVRLGPAVGRGPARGGDQSECGAAVRRPGRQCSTPAVCKLLVHQRACAALSAFESLVGVSSVAVCVCVPLCKRVPVRALGGWRRHRGALCPAT